MKIPMPPTGGQGGHYGRGSQGRTRIFDNRQRASIEGKPVPKRFRRLRLRKRKRSRMGHEHPLMFVFVLVVVGILAIPLAGIAWGIVKHVFTSVFS